MRAVFVDTLYWIAITRPGDPWQVASKQAKAALGKVRFVTTDEVLSEFLAGLSSGGEHVRQKVAVMVRAIHNDPNTKVLAQSRDSFLKALELYESRRDKEYSLTDCVSMNAMWLEGINDVLTYDRHFQQEGFNVLVR